MRWMSSTHPPSISRCPCWGSNPVVSVSTTISRIARLDRVGESVPARHFSDRLQNRTHLFARRFNSLRRVHDKIGPPTLLRIRHLLGENGLELLDGHARTRKDTRSLRFGGCGNHHHCVHPPLALGLEQERNVQNDKLFVPRLRLMDEDVFSRPHER